MATLTTIPVQSGEVIRALLTLGAGAGASATNLRGTQSYVTQTGQVAFAGVPGMTLNGIHPYSPSASQGAVRFRQRDGGFNTWRAIEGNDAVEVRIAVSTDGDTVRLGIQNSIGGGYWNWEFPGLPPVVALVDHADPVGALAEWASTTLIVPPGHPRSGEPLALLDFAVDWLRESWTTHESALSTARKNAKSANPQVVVWTGRRPTCSVQTKGPRHEP